MTVTERSGVRATTRMGERKRTGSTPSPATVIRSPTFSSPVGAETAKVTRLRPTEFALAGIADMGPVPSTFHLALNVKPLKISHCEFGARFTGAELWAPRTPATRAAGPPLETDHNRLGTGQGRVSPADSGRAGWDG